MGSRGEDVGDVGSIGVRTFLFWGIRGNGVCALGIWRKDLNGFLQIRVMIFVMVGIRCEDFDVLGIRGKYIGDVVGWGWGCLCLLGFGVRVFVVLGF